MSSIGSAAKVEKLGVLGKGARSHELKAHCKNTKDEQAPWSLPGGFFDTMIFMSGHFSVLKNALGNNEDTKRSSLTLL
jgi:hypothetical protein